MMELKRRSRVRIAAICAATTMGCDELRLQFPAPLLLTPIERFAPLSNSIGRELLWREPSRRSLRGVVYAEWRALEAESATVEHPDLAGDLSPRREFASTFRAQLHPRRAPYGLPWAAQRPMRTTVQASLAIAQIETGTTNKD